MKKRPLGRTGLSVSELGFGCGMIGGLLVRGEYPAMRQAVARAIELGINYFDTAPLYGKGQSEVNIGAVLRELGADALVGTKMGLTQAELPRLEEAIEASVHASLRRLGRERIDVLHLHNPLAKHGGRPDWAALSMLNFPSVLRTFERLHQHGKIGCWGITGLGDSELLHEAIQAGGFHTIQTVFNLLNPTSGYSAPAGFPFQDYGRLIDQAAAKGMGLLAIRVLAGGALSGTADRHPTAAREVNPIASSPDYRADVGQAKRFQFLVDKGTVENLVEAAIRFVIGKPEIATALVGISSGEQLEQAVQYANRGPLPGDALARIAELQQSSPTP
jgi:aryl-alcohol dehydrogenase-like predicted oxidoreductase